METEVTEKPEINSNTDNLAVAEQANVEEAFTAEAKAINEMENFLKKERKTQAY